MARRSKTRTPLTRRDFLKASGTGSGALLAGAVPAIAFSTATVQAQQSWDREADVVVVGSGAAAASAALFAHEAGAQVVMLEKADTYGGTTARSGGAVWAPNNSYMRKKGLADPKADCLRYMARVSYPQIYSAKDAKFGLPDNEYALLEAHYDHAGEAVDGLVQIGVFPGFDFFGVEDDGTPIVTDHFAHLAEDKAPRGRSLLPLRDDGTRGNGGLWALRTKAAVESRNIPILTGHRVSRLLQNGRGEVVGVQATLGGGKTVTVRARKGVIFGSGGFTHDPELCLHYLRGPIFGGCAVPTNEGDFVRMGIDAGAALANMNNAWWNALPLEAALKLRSTTNLGGQPGGDSMITVNRFGRRTGNEKIVWSGKGDAFFWYDPTTATYPNMVQFGIYDQFTRERFGGSSAPIPKPGVDSPFVLSGNTLEELAAAIAQRLASLAAQIGDFTLADTFVAGLKEEIARFNRFAETGKDLDFRRGEGPMDSTARRDGNDKPNPTMYPISDKGPYYAVLIGAGTLDTNGGPKINASAQVLDTRDQPIPGLYGAGNCIGSPAGQGYWGHGGTIGPAATFGRQAALHAASQPVRDWGGSD